MTLILGFYGSSTIQLEPNSSRLVKVNAFFVQAIQVGFEFLLFSILFLGTAADPTFFYLNMKQAEEIHETLPGTMVYGFTKVPPLDVLTTWPEKHDVVVESGHHKVTKNFVYIKKLHA